MGTKKNVLLTNDDGFDSCGIKLLYTILNKYYNVVIVAPDTEKSGVGHSFTFKKPLFYKKILNSYAKDIYSISGTPADCVKFAIGYLLPNKPDIIVSGLNRGENSGIASHYSGTVAAAREGSFWRIKSFAFSIFDEAMDFSQYYLNLIPEIINQLSEFGSFFKNNGFFNINFPSCNPSITKGIKITKQSCAFFNDKYEKIVVKEDDLLKDGYIVNGEKVEIENDDNFDSRALLNNWITITPITYDSTAYEEILSMKKIENSIIFRGIQNER